MGEIKTADWREAYPVGSEVEARHGCNDIDRKWHRAKVQAAAPDERLEGWARQMADGTMHVAKAKVLAADGFIPKADAEAYIARALAAAPTDVPAPREPRVGDVWRAAVHGASWRLTSPARDGLCSAVVVASGTSHLREGHTTEQLTVYRDIARGNPGGFWTLIRAAEDAPQPQTPGDEVEARWDPERKEWARTYRGVTPEQLQRTLERALPAPPPLRCPHCTDGVLTRAHTVAVYRCRECHWTGTEADRARASEPVRPEPRFKVGDWVRTRDGFPAQVMHVRGDGEIAEVSVALRAASRDGYEETGPMLCRVANLVAAERP